METVAKVDAMVRLIWNNRQICGRATYAFAVAISPFWQSRSKESGIWKKALVLNTCAFGSRLVRYVTIFGLIK